jgi:hypothetical protein
MGLVFMGEKIESDHPKQIAMSDSQVTLSETSASLDWADEDCGETCENDVEYPAEESSETPAAESDDEPVAGSTDESKLAYAFVKDYTLAAGDDNKRLELVLHLMKQSPSFVVTVLANTHQAGKRSVLRAQVVAPYGGRGGSRGGRGGGRGGAPRGDGSRGGRGGGRGRGDGSRGGRGGGRGRGDGSRGGRGGC